MHYSYSYTVPKVLYLRRTTEYEIRVLNVERWGWPYQSYGSVIHMTQRFHLTDKVSRLLSGPDSVRPSSHCNVAPPQQCPCIILPGQAKEEKHKASSPHQSPGLLFSLVSFLFFFFSVSEPERCCAGISCHTACVNRSRTGCAALAPFHDNYRSDNCRPPRG